MRFRLALGVSAMCSVLAVPAAAQAIPGDPGISDPAPGTFRLDAGNLEPGCFVVRGGPASISSHLDLTYLADGDFVRELHVSVDRTAPFNVDQVLVPSTIDGYNVVNEFVNTNRAADIGPDQTAVDLFAPDSDGDNGPDNIALGSVIVCVSDHGAAQNEPYQQEAGGLVSAKNRPIIAPKVTALGQSAISNLKTYKMGFGYEVEKWFAAPVYDGALPYSIPSTVRLDPRSDDFPYDARRVNDVDQFGEEFTGLDKIDYGQTRLFKREGDLTAWTSSNNNNPDTLAHLITFNAQGDLPMSWTLRPSLASPASQRSVSFTEADFRAWEKSWQDYYCGKGPHPTMALAPGTNSPDLRDCAVAVNPPESMPVPTPANPTPAPVVVNPTPVTVNNSDAASTCVSHRVIRFTWGRSAKSGKLMYRGRSIKAKRSNGKLRARADFRGLSVAPGSYMKVVKMTTKKGGHKAKDAKWFKVC